MMKLIMWRHGMGSEVGKRIQLMRIYSERGRTLSSILPLIGITRATAIKYARHNEIAFVDYKRRKPKVATGDTAV
jgi:hypothetical protein